MPYQKLFQEFPPVPTEQWEEIIQTDLKGAEYEKKLIWKTPEEFPVKPYYRAEDLTNCHFLKTLPGEYPFLRGTHLHENTWEIRHDVWVDKPTEANTQALDLLKNGVHSVRFCFSKDSCAKFLNEPSFYILLRDIPLDSTPVHFTAGNRTKDVLSILKKVAVTNQSDPKKISGTIDFNVLGNLTASGNYFESEGQDFASLIIALLKARKHFGDIRIIGIEGSIFRNAGSTIVQELAFSLSMANEYLEILTRNGVSVEDAFRSIHFTFAAGPVYFLEIARLRAARILWSYMADAWKLDNHDASRMKIHTETCRFNRTIYDPYVNMLRNTTEAMAAVLGGTDSLSVYPHDVAYCTPSAFSERIARNVQLILKEEAYFDRVADPAGGSYYIENLTESITRAALDILKKTEAEGGYLACLHRGYIQEQIEKSAASKTSNLSSRREILVGTNQYPNFTETMLETVKEEIAFSRKKTEHPTLIKPVRPSRAAEALEKLRLATEKSPFRPKVFLLPLGNLAMRVARANFSANFFAVAGFEILDNPGFNAADEGVQAALDHHADLIVVCSSDEEYPEVVPAVQESLSAKTSPGGKIPVLVVAGAPPCMDDLKAKGINWFIHVRSNVLETLEKFQKELGIL